MRLHARFFRHRLAAGAVAAGLFALTAPSGALAQTEDAAQDVAAQIRAQGYACEDPVTATQDTAASEPDEAAWHVECANASYLVKLRPDMAAEIEELE